MSNDKHNPNVELIGQGIANIVSPLFGGLPATGAIARTATNVRPAPRRPSQDDSCADIAGHCAIRRATGEERAPCRTGCDLMIVAYNMAIGRKFRKS